jgi:hypothetical protein
MSLPAFIEYEFASVRPNKHIGRYSEVLSPTADETDRGIFAAGFAARYGEMEK